LSIFTFRRPRKSSHLLHIRAAFRKRDSSMAASLQSHRQQQMLGPNLAGFHLVRKRCGM
jgi:hypothetical protein